VLDNKVVLGKFQKNCNEHKELFQNQVPQILLERSNLRFEGEKERVEGEATAS
jgi:hypothetical protein